MSRSEHSIALAALASRSLSLLPGTWEADIRVVIRVSIVAACVVVAPDTATAQEAPAVDTHVIARTATDQGTYHYAQVFQQRGKWILPDIGYIDFNKFDEYREVWVGAGGVLLETTHLSVIGEGHIVKALGPSSGGALYLQPWVLVAYHLTQRLGGDAVYFPYLPLNDAGRRQHILERAKLEYEIGHIKVGGGYAGFKSGPGAWKSKPFVTATIKAGSIGAIELWLQQRPGERVTIHVRYAKTFREAP